MIEWCCRAGVVGAESSAPRSYGVLLHGSHLRKGGGGRRSATRPMNGVSEQQVVRATGRGKVALEDSDSCAQAVAKLCKQLVHVQETRRQALLTC